VSCSKIHKSSVWGAAIAFIGVMMFSACAFGATATFDIVPVDADPDEIVPLEDRTIVPIEGTNDFEVRVQPGGEIPYEIYVTVTSDTPEVDDNGGLAFFSMTVETDLGVEQPPADELEPTIAQWFSVVLSLGTPLEDDIVQIGGGQQTFGGDIQFNVAANDRILLANGRVIASSENLDTFSVEIGEQTTANVFVEEGLEDVTVANVAFGQRIVVQTTLDLNEGLSSDDDDDGSEGGDGGDGDGSDGEDDGDTGDGGDDGSILGVDLPTISPETGAILAGAMLAVIGLGSLVFGPWGIMIALVLAPAAALIAILSGAI